MFMYLCIMFAITVLYISFFNKRYVCKTLCLLKIGFVTDVKL